MAKTLQEILGTPPKDSMFEPVEAGRYMLSVEVAETREARQREDGSMGYPSVHTQMRILNPGGPADNRVLFQDFYVNMDNPGLLGFIKSAYARITGNDLAGAIQTDTPENADIAEALAEGIRGGKIMAKVGVRKDNRIGHEGEKVNFIVAWVDELN